MLVFLWTCWSRQSFITWFLLFTDSIQCSVMINTFKSEKQDWHFNSLRPRQDGRHFRDDIFKCIFLNENARISLKKSLKFVPRVRINNIPALVQIMAWRRSGDKPLSEPMVVSLLTHICITQLQWVKDDMLKCIFLDKRILIWISMVCFQWHKANIGLGTGLTQSRHQVITRTNDSIND